MKLKEVFVVLVSDGFDDQCEVVSAWSDYEEARVEVERLKQVAGQNAGLESTSAETNVAAAYACFLSMLVGDKLRNWMNGRRYLYTAGKIMEASDCPQSYVKEI